MPKIPFNYDFASNTYVARCGDCLTVLTMTKADLVLMSGTPVVGYANHYCTANITSPDYSI